MLRSILKEIRSVADLSALFRELGYVPDNQPFETTGTVVATWKGFRVIATECDNPGDAVRRLARALARYSARALAVAVGPDKTIVFACPRLGTPYITRVMTVPCANPTAEALEHLSELRPKTGSTGLAHALRVVELLSTEIAGERFFRSFRIVLDRMTQVSGTRETESERQLAALLPLTRVLFLYFVQAKGWLDGRTDYMRTLLDRSLASGRHFHRSALNPLFFHTLNKPLSQRTSVVRLGKIPYLNGGLFQAQPVEMRMRAIYSNELWREAFDSLFEKFRFCVREADEVDAVAPDMLGHVFERAMESKARRDTGSFYTPESVVRELVIASVEIALGQDAAFSKDQAHRIATCQQIEPALHRRARRKLHGLRILDPAVGSGAFLMGALECLCEMHLALKATHVPAARLQSRRRILRQNLFGVDINPIAVRLAELRLWLTVIADDPTTDITLIEPLPNLDGVIRQGDSLMDPVAAASAMGAGPGAVPASMTRQIATARDAVFHTRGAELGTVVKKLRSAEHSLALSLLQSALANVDHELKDLTAIASGRDLFGRRSGLSIQQRQRRRLLRSHRDTLQRTATTVTEGGVPFFAFEVHTPDVLRNGGFSIVLGNPPWVRAERVSSGLRHSLKERFEWWNGGGGARGFAHLPDLSVAFLERAVKLTAPGGVVAFLVPSKTATAQYAETARSHIVKEATIHYLHRLPEHQASSFGATTYPLAVILTNRKPPPNHRVALDLGAERRIRQSALSNGGPWIFVTDADRSALDDFQRSGTPLGQVARPVLGIKTGVDRIFVGEVVATHGPTCSVRFRNTDTEIETQVLRPALRGRDIKAFTCAHTRVLLWGYDDKVEPLRALPKKASDYLSRHRRKLESRADLRGGPPWTLFRLAAARSSHRVAWADIARRPAAVVLEDTPCCEALPLNSCYISCAPDRDTARVICAVVNSTFAHALAVTTADEARGGYRRINARVASRFPLPTDIASKPLTGVIQTCHRDQAVDQDTLDELVATALSLSERTCDRLRRLAQHHR